jgi:D-alanyl-D-alanine carboxypeptidase
MDASRKNSAQKNKCEEILMNFKTVLVIASLVLSAGLTSCKGTEPEAPKTDTPPAAVTTPVEAPKTDAKPADGKTDAKPADGKTDAKPADGKTDAKPDAKKDEKKGDAMKPDAKKDEKKPN